MGKIKRKDLMDLNNIMQELSGEVHQIKFAFFVAKNIGLMKTEINAINEVNKPSEEAQEFEKKRIVICEKYAERNEEGKPKILNNSYILGENKAKFEEEMKPFKPEQDKIMKDEKERMACVEEIFEEEIDFDGHELDFNNLPEKIKPNFLNKFLEAGLVKDELT